MLPGDAYGPVMRRGTRDPVSGYLHLAGLALSAVGACALMARAWGARSLLATCATYAIGLVALYGASSAYHLVSADDRIARRLRKLDHGAIFLMIAGTCTPIFFCAFDGTVRWAMLVAVWIVAALGIVLRLTWMGAPRVVYTAIYVAMGWMVLVQGRRALATLPPAVVALTLAGGVVYTAGAVVYGAKRPDPLPGRFGFHEIWHLFVLAGSSLHYGAIFVLAGGALR
jgi:hemolysin III